MAFFVYILFSEKTNRFYYGQTQNLNVRMEKHNNGYVKSTKHGIPWILLAFKSVESRSNACKLEVKIKRLHHPDKIYAFVLNHQFRINPEQVVIGPEKK
ncbi:MAG: GIY-YIG nuclease family protein [Bacteroidales bacterium]|nr:GIY-YIG nuclease family protein [Bacteroidales bacterium]